MIEIILLAFAASVFPALLACVAILISRPEPRALLLAFYLGGLLMSLTAGAIVLSLFNDGDSVAGSTRSAPHPAVSILQAVLALALAWLMISGRGRVYLERWRTRHPRRHRRQKEAGPSWMERHLDQASPRVAFLVGAVINLPGPFYLLALGDIAAGDYSTGQQAALIVLFNAIMFLLLEIPLVGYLLRPAETAARVTVLRRWLNANGLRVMGGVVGLFGLGYLIQGVGALVG